MVLLYLYVSVILKSITNFKTSNIFSTVYFKFLYLKLDEYFQIKDPLNESFNHILGIYILISLLIPKINFLR